MSTEDIHIVATCQYYTESLYSTNMIHMIFVSCFDRMSIDTVIMFKHCMYLIIVALLLLVGKIHVNY